MFEYVKDAKLKHLGTYQKRAKTDMIVLHHFASDASVQLVHVWHGFRIHYNIVIQLDGTAVWGRGIDTVGGHVLNSGPSKGIVARSIGIACQGNFQNRKMPDKQKATLLRVIRDCLKKHPTIKSIIPHSDVRPTACPGKYFPLTEAKAVLNEKPAPAPKPPTPTMKLNRVIQEGDRGYDVLELQKELIRRKYNVGKAGADGVFGSITEAAVRRFQQRMGIKADGVVGKVTLVKLGGKWTGK